MRIIGTNRFPNDRAAFAYYAEYGFTQADVIRKWHKGEIQIGSFPFDTLKPGESVKLIDHGTRYAIVTE